MAESVPSRCHRQRTPASPTHRPPNPLPHQPPVFLIPAPLRPAAKLQTHPRDFSSVRAHATRPMPRSNSARKWFLDTFSGRVGMELSVAMIPEKAFERLPGLDECWEVSAAEYETEPGERFLLVTSHSK